MKQVTLRLDEALADRLRSVASERGESVNTFASTVLSAAVDPEHAGAEVERIRERLGRAGLLVRPKTLPAGTRPSKAELARARRAAGRGKPLSDYVAEGRS